MKIGEVYRDLLLFLDDTGKLGVWNLGIQLTLMPRNNH